MDFPAELKNALSQPLPGSKAQNIMAPEGRNNERFVHKYTASVLIALFHKVNRWQFPLIQRIEDGYVHSGQIGLPGGKLEIDETTVECALREAHEEIGLKPDCVKIIGQLSSLPIPVSKYLVYPVIGIIKSEIQWSINPEEVKSIFTASLNDIRNPAPIKTEMWQFGKDSRKVPFFYFNQHKVWGATAMILSEFKAVIETI